MALTIHKSAESNFEEPLEPMTYKERKNRLDVFMKKIRETRNSGNVNRLEIYLNQCVDWYHGKKVRYWKTTFEYRIRWKKHVDWILGSPAVSNECKFVDITNPDKPAKLEVEYDDTVKEYYEYNIEDLREEHRLIGTDKLKVKSTPSKPKLTLVTDCSCGSSHDSLFECKPTLRKHYTEIFMKEHGGTTVPVTEVYDIDKKFHYYRTGQPRIEEFGWEVVKVRSLNTKFRRYKQNQTLKLDNYYTILGSDAELGDPMPCYLSPCEEDRNILGRIPNTKKGKNELKKIKKDYKLSKRDKYKIKVGDYKKREKRADSRLECSKLYFRKQISREMPTSEYFKKVGIDESKIEGIANKLGLANNKSSINIAKHSNMPGIAEDIALDKLKWSKEILKGLRFTRGQYKLIGNFLLG